MQTEVPQPQTKLRPIAVPVEVPPVVSTRHGFWRRHPEWLWSALLLGPYLVGLLLLQVGPIISSILISFCHWDNITPPVWAGFANYQTLARDPLFWKALWNTFYFAAVFVPLSIALALALALLVNRPLRSIALYRTAIFLPVVTSTVAVSLIWMWIYDRNYGLLNYGIQSVVTLLGFKAPPPVPWLSSPSTAMFSIILMSVWKSVGYNMVILLAGLQGIPRHLYEAAELDGAGPVRRGLHVTLPLLSPVIFFVAIISIIGAFQVFDQVYVMAQDGRPANSTLTLVYYLYRHAFQYLEMGSASAVGAVLFAIILLITGVQLWLQKFWVHYS
jgi:multiple sugar transport system permease protein